MARPTIFQRLGTVFTGTDTLSQNTNSNTNIYGVSGDTVLLRTKDADEFKQKSLELKQDMYLAKQWKRAQFDLSNRSLAGLNEVKMMYRDADLMDTFPEIGAALDIFSEEACVVKNEGLMVNVSSKSERIKAILEDLLVNRLTVNTTLPMVCRAMCKYGNNFMLLNINKENGVIGWKQLPVYEIERYENGMDNPYASSFAQFRNDDLNRPETTKFVWVGSSEYTPFMNWQIAHFRLLYDSLFLPYGVSALHKARRHFRMLSMMEDMMLIYRLERSIERRVFKINVGAINAQDVPAYVQSVADEFKRTPIVDPRTGQLDLKKNLLNVSEDYFIPVRDDNAPSPIDTLQGAQNMTAMDDIKFIQNKVMTALRVPKSFLNFEESQGDGKNLSMMDVRFTRTVNRIQQALLMELNKICIVHLYLLGFTDDLTNFSLKMNNPSSQAEMMELENLAKKVTTAKDAMTDGGSGIPLMSATRAWREIMGWSDKEIKENLEDLRLERALAAELERTQEIIKRTRLFDPVDNIYGEPGAEYSAQGGGQEGEEGPGGGGGAMGGGFGGGGEFDFGEEGAEGEMPEEDMGAEGEMDMGAAAGEDVGAPPSPEGGAMGENSIRRMMKNMITEQKTRRSKLIKERKSVFDRITERHTEKKPMDVESIPIFQKNFLVNEELDSMSRQLDGFVNGD